MMSNYGNCIELEREIGYKDGIEEEHRDNLEISGTSIAKDLERELSEKTIVGDRENLTELIEAAQRGNKGALEELIMLCNPIVLKKVSTFYIVNYDNDDLIQMARLSVIKAINTYDVAKGSGFFYYVRFVVTNEFYYRVRSAEKEKLWASINVPVSGGAEFGDFIEDPMNLEEEVIERNELMKLKKALNELDIEEREFILKYGIERGGITRYCREKGLTEYLVKKKKNNILKKLRMMMER